jgi:glycosyltransferase involved in cell wall biosynthesis
VSRPIASIFIRVRDEAERIEQVLTAISGQELDGEFEVVVLDNESTDGTPDVAALLGARVFTLPRALFGYGLAINVGMDLCRGDIVVVLSAHSVPCGPTWLSQLVQPLRETDVVGAAYCRQVSPVALSPLGLRRFDPFATEHQIVDRQRLLACRTTGEDPYRAACFSNSACAIRREVALRHAFRNLLDAEDRAFVIDYVLAGGTVVYLPQACVAYERRTTIQGSFRAGYRGHVSMRVIRQLYANYTGFDFDLTRGIVIRMLGALPLLSVVLAQMLLVTTGSPVARRRATADALRAAVSTLGRVLGMLLWRRHMDTLAYDRNEIAAVRIHCRAYVEGRTDSDNHLAAASDC